MPQELCSVVNDSTNSQFCSSQLKGKSGTVPGAILSDAKFDLANFKTALDGKYSVVHIASHFNLKAGNETDSYLLLGGKDERKLNLSSFRQDFKTKLVGIDLLALSACNTAMNAGAKSNGVEIEGFSAMAQNQGARTVLASLWSVADSSTKDLMAEFYNQLKTDPKIGKAEALRKAQILFLQGKY